FEASNYAAKDNQISNIRGVAVIISIYMREAFFLELTNQVLIKGSLEFRGQLDLVRLDHDDLDPGSLDLCRPLVLRQERVYDQRDGYQHPGESNNDALHCFCSLLAESVPVGFGSFGELVCAPADTSSALTPSALPAGMVKITACKLPVASSWYLRVSV